MAGICDRCSEKTSQLVSISPLPEMRPIMHLGYRMVCMDCYDDLLVEAREGSAKSEEEDDRIVVSIPARVEGNTKHFEPFADEMTIEEVGREDLWIRTSRELDAGTLLKVIVPSYGLELTVIVEVVTAPPDEPGVELRLSEQSEGWTKLYQDYSSETSG